MNYFYKFSALRFVMIENQTHSGSGNVFPTFLY